MNFTLPVSMYSVLIVGKMFSWKCRHAGHASDAYSMISTGASALPMTTSCKAVSVSTIFASALPMKPSETTVAQAVAISVRRVNCILYAPLSQVITSEGVMLRWLDVGRHGHPILSKHREALHRPRLPGFSRYQRDDLAPILEAVVFYLVSVLVKVRE